MLHPDAMLAQVIWAQSHLALERSCPPAYKVYRVSPSSRVAIVRGVVRVLHSPSTFEYREGNSREGA